MWCKPEREVRRDKICAARCCPVRQVQQREALPYYETYYIDCMDPKFVVMRSPSYAQCAITNLGCAAKHLGSALCGQEPVSDDVQHSSVARQHYEGNFGRCSAGVGQSFGAAELSNQI